jgi:hypothetical protein
VVVSLVCVNRWTAQRGRCRRVVVTRPAGNSEASRIAAARALIATLHRLVKPRLSATVSLAPLDQMHDHDVSAHPDKSGQDDEQSLPASATGPLRNIKEGPSLLAFFVVCLLFQSTRLHTRAVPIHSGDAPARFRISGDESRPPTTSAPRIAAESHTCPRFTSRVNSQAYKGVTEALFTTRFPTTTTTAPTPSSIQIRINNTPQP